MLYRKEPEGRKGRVVGGGDGAVGKGAIETDCKLPILQQIFRGGGSGGVRGMPVRIGRKEEKREDADGGFMKGTRGFVGVSV